MEKQMYQGDWKCCICGKEITQLPFEPKNTSNLICLDCHKAKLLQREKPSERKMFEGNWKCSRCGGVITQLPFEPRSEENLVCINCYRNSKPSD